ncbi:MAG: OmpH family outer membrane protein [Alistipes sp.]|nr:OmpH family outer membrane protein [Alistipes sp.]MDE6507514.1 OmpH family outer membrane protein [Alistipes sp.]MDE7077168.1 OmpH family outer membrane protein [Alistipes sp.]
MKKAIKLTLAVALMLSASSLFAQKLGRINSQDILLAMPETKEMETNMQAFTKDLQDNLETISVEFNQKLTDYQKNYSTYSDSVRQLKERELQELQNRRQEFEQVAQQDIQKKQQELLTPIIEKAKAAIDKVAKDNGYLAIFETGSLASYDEAALTDIAPQVRAELGIADAPAAQ